jgi:catechol 2,3-dioxygenase-like lactoylglutathione lyase family enzyme
MITGINHITFAVVDAAASLRFYEDVLGMSVLAKWSGGAYLLAGNTWLALVADDRTRKSVLPEHSHIAFSVSQAEFANVSQRVIASGATIWQDNATEGDSLYFLDPSGHKLEIHASDLQAQLRAAWPGLEITPAGRCLLAET